MKIIQCEHCGTDVSIHDTFCYNCDRYPHHDSCGYYKDLECICDIPKKED